jgi:hypothetical protein
VIKHERSLTGGCDIPAGHTGIGRYTGA